MTAVRCRYGSVRVIDLVGLRPELPGLLISHRLPLDAAREAFASAAARNKGAINLETAVGCFDSRYGHDMHTKICEFLRTLWVIPKTLHGFSKNLKAAGRRYHSWQGLRPLPASDALPVIRHSGTLRFPDNSVPNCGF